MFTSQKVVYITETKMQALLAGLWAGSTVGLACPPAAFTDPPPMSPPFNNTHVTNGWVHCNNTRCGRQPASIISQLATTTTVSQVQSLGCRCCVFG